MPLPVQACNRGFSCNCGFQCNRGCQGPFGFICPQGLQRVLTCIRNLACWHHEPMITTKDDFGATTPTVLLQCFQHCVLVSLAETSIEKTTGISLVTRPQHLCDSTVAPRHPFLGWIFRRCGGMSGGARTDQLHILWECRGIPSLAQRPRKP